MKNLSRSTVYSSFANVTLFALLLFNGAQVTAQYDLIYENHEQNLVRWVRAIADDGQGNTSLAGRFQVSLTLGAFTLTNNGTNEPGGSGGTGFVGKFNSTSNSWLWAKKITIVSNGSNSDIMDMAIDNAGNTYVTGYYIGVVGFDNITLTSTKQGNQYTTDIFVAKYNTNGGVVWAKSFGSKAGLDMGRAIALDASNNIFIGGIFTNKAINCGGSITYDLYDIYLAKLNNSGTALWQKRYANTSLVCANAYNNKGNALSIDASGNAFLAGQFSGTVIFGSGSGMTISSVNGTVDLFAAKINGSGTTQWVKSAGSSSNDYGETIYADGSGNVYAGGRVTNAFLTKYNSTGNVVWSVNPFPVSPEFEVTGISRITPYSNSILVNDSYVGFKTISPDDGAVISSDSLVGNTLGGAQIKDVAVAGSGYVFNVMGHCGTVTIGTTPLVSFNECPYSGISNDIFMVQTGSVEPPPAFQTGNEIIDPLDASQEFSKHEIEVYPNPVKDQLHITLPEYDTEIVLFIQDQLGHTIWSEEFESQRRTGTISLDGHSFQSGMYYLTCLSNGVVKTKQFVIEK